MNSNIIAYIQQLVPLTEEEAQQFASSFQEAKIKKRQFIVQPDFVATHRNHILHGAFRAYVVAGEGQDNTIAFAIDDRWITDYNSYIFQQPATMFVVALKDSIISRIDYDKEQALKKSNHKF